MKKNLFILIASLFLSGSMFAQQYQTHWPDFNLHDYQMHGDIIAVVEIDSTMITLGDDYASYEVGFFVNDVCRGHAFLCQDAFFSYPVLRDSACIYYDQEIADVGLAVSFKLYDHVHQFEYDVCTTDVPIVTGTDYISFYYYYHPIVLNFQSPIFTKSITGHNSGGGWHLIASPLLEDVTPTEANGLLTSAYDLYRFNQSAAPLEWQNYKAHSDDFVLENGKGYLYANSNNVNLVFKGMPFTGTEKIVDLDYTTGVEFAGWNLVGNPFTENAYCNKPYYTISEEGSYINAFPVTDGDAIPAMEGVFVVATGENQSVTFTTQEPIRMPSTLALNVTHGHGIVDRAIVRFDEGGTLPKLQLFEGSTKVYIPMDNKDYAVVRSESMGVLPVNFKAESNGSYTLSFSNREVTFSYLHLIDNMNGNDIDLLQTPSYTFDARITDYESRFKLVFTTGTSDDDNFAFYSNGNFIINNDDEATLQVVDVAGRILSSETINGSVSKAINAAPGIYMLHLIKGDDMKVQKIIIR